MRAKVAEDEMQNLAFVLRFLRVFPFGLLRLKTHCQAYELRYIVYLIS
jgi:hypothetical protein